MPVSTRPIRDVLVERQIADEAAAFDIATVIGEVVEESQSELMTKSDGRAMIAEMREMFGKLDAKLDALEVKVDAKLDALEARLERRIAEQQARIYRFILLVGTATTTIISIVAAVT